MHMRTHAYAYACTHAHVHACACAPLQVRFGGVLLLEGFEMPDQAVIEGLNALLEIDRSFRSGVDLVEPVPVHPQLFVVATAHEASAPSASREHAPLPEGLSPAVVSRLTLIRVEPPSFADWRVQYGQVLARRLAGPHAKVCLEYLFDAIASPYSLCLLTHRLLDPLPARCLLACARRCASSTSSTRAPSSPSCSRGSCIGSRSVGCSDGATTRASTAN